MRNQHTLDPGGHDRDHFARPVNVVEAPIFIGDDALAQRILVIEIRVAGVGLVIWIHHRCGAFPVDVLKVLVTLGFLLQLGLGGLERDDHKAGLLEIITTGRIENTDCAGFTTSSTGRLSSTLSTVIISVPIW